MKNKVQKLGLLMLAWVLAFAAAATVQADPIEVRTWHDLHNMRDNMQMGTVYILMNDLDETTDGYSDYNVNESWLPIGNSENRFSATFDGQGYAIIGLTINSESSFRGLFGHAHFATIKNLKVLDADITTTTGDVGVLAGRLEVCEVENVTLSGSLRQVGEATATQRIGGMSGQLGGGVVKNSAVYVDIDQFGRFVGGFTGQMTAGARIEQSYFKGSITSSNPNADTRWIGGLTGQFGGLSFIDDSYAITDIEGAHVIGGLIGYHWRGGSTITNSYFVGTITGNPELAPLDGDENPILAIGGVTGHSDPDQGGGESLVVNTFWNSEVSGLDNSYGTGEYPTDNIGEGKTTAELKLQATFTGWDFEGVWSIDVDTNDGYPQLLFALVTDADQDSRVEIPDAMTLSQNYPNPFNPSTVITYRVSGDQHVRLSVYDVTGREIAVLVDRQQAPGEYQVNWDAGQLSSGIYIYRLEAGGQTLTRNMTFVK
jgi:hypothetical protein